MRKRAEDPLSDGEDTAISAALSRVLRRLVRSVGDVYKMDRACLMRCGLPGDPSALQVRWNLASRRPDGKRLRPMLVAEIRVIRRGPAAGVYLSAYVETSSPVRGRRYRDALKPQTEKLHGL